MHTLRLMIAPAQLLTAVLLILSLFGTTQASVIEDDAALTPRAYLPLVATWGCPARSANEYTSGTARQVDDDDPVRPAEDHADKNIELRGYTLTDPAVRGFVDYGCDDKTAQPPQFATLFNPARVPAMTAYYQVHNWEWAKSPEPGDRGDLITNPPVTALGLQTTPGEVISVPESGYSISEDPEMEVLIVFADQDTVALKYTREDGWGTPADPFRGYLLHVDNICTDPNLLALYNQLDDPDGPRYDYPNPDYPLPNLPAGDPIGVARGSRVVVAIVDTGAFQDPRSLEEWWQIRPGVASEGVLGLDNDYANLPELGLTFGTSSNEPVDSGPTIEGTRYQCAITN